MKSASILDFRKENLDPAIWDISGEAPVMRPEAREEIINRLIQGLADNGFEKAHEWIDGLFVIGSSTTYQWEPTSDIDVSVKVDPDKFISLELQNAPDVDDEMIRQMLGEIAWESLNEIDLPGTKHPVNYFFMTSAYDLELTDASYNLLDNEWLKLPPDVPKDFDPEMSLDEAWNMARGWAARLDEEIGETRRDVRDYDLLVDYFKNLNDENRGWVSDRIQEKVDEIESDVAGLASEYEELHDARVSAFTTESRDFDRDKLLQYSRNWLPENIVYKYLERYNYLQLLKALKNVYRDSYTNEGEFVEDVKQVIDKKAIINRAFDTIYLSGSDLDAVSAAMTAIAGIIYNSNAEDLIKTYAAFRVSLELLVDEYRAQEQARLSDPWYQVLHPEEHAGMIDPWETILSDPGADQYQPFSYAAMEKRAELSLQRLEWFKRALQKFDPLVRQAKDPEITDAYRRMKEILETIGFVDQRISRESFEPDYPYMTK